MMFLLALLLALGLPQVQANNRTKRQENLRCHVCERENDFTCTNEVTCHVSEKHCMIAAIKIFPRFYMVSKQCSNYCPLIETRAEPPQQPKPFVLVKKHPLPFFYVKCCQDTLCNTEGPSLDPTAFREHTGHAGERRRSHAVLTLVASATALAGPRLL